HATTPIIIRATTTPFTRFPFFVMVFPSLVLAPCIRAPFDAYGSDHFSTRCSVKVDWFLHSVPWWLASENDTTTAWEVVEQAERARLCWARGSSLAGGSTVARMKRAEPERSLGAVSMASAPWKGFSERDLSITRYAHNPSAHIQGTTLKTMDAKPSATNQCHRNTTPITARTVSRMTHPRRLNIALRTLSMTSRHRHEYFRVAAIRRDLMDRDRLGSGPR